jgi:hypothetical protein
LHQRVARRAHEEAEQAAVRQAYYYLVIAVGLGLFSVGLILLLTTLLSFLSLTPVQLAADWFRDRISDAATLVIVGAPIWLGHWQYQQHLAEEQTTSRAERAAFWRRVFLYLVIFATVVAVVVDAANLLYLLFLVALGENPPFGPIEVARTPASVIAVASVLLWYHLRILRADGAATRLTQSSGPILAAIILRATTRTELDQLLGQVSGALENPADVTILQEPRLEEQFEASVKRIRSL